MNNLKSKLKSKMKKQGGFTLVEMLIVVAIIAILIMVSIPMVSSALERAREAVDEANERSAFGVAEVRYLSSLGATGTETNDTYIKWDDTTSSETFYYKVSGGQGTLEHPASAPNAGDAGYDYGQCTNHAGDFIKVTIFKNGSVTVEWNNSKAPHHNYIGSAG